MEANPRVTRTADDIPGDPLNVALFGTEPELVGAFAAAGFARADALGLRSDLHIGESVVLDRRPAQVSNLFCRPQRMSRSSRKSGTAPIACVRWRSATRATTADRCGWALRSAIATPA
jgi:hypothetical protein